MLEATQTARGEIVFEESKKWEGQVVNGRYPLRQYIGGSDHSAVFLTEILGDNPQKKAAIKLIAAHEAHADIQLARLKLAAKVSHPHLLRIFEVGSCRLEDHQLLFVVMEYADETLSQILPQRPLTSQEMRDLLAPTVETLAYIHNNGFAHGHLKPANILVVGEQIKLSSDGLCRPGTPTSGRPTAYAPPEAANEGLIAAGDIWSLAITISEALTQRLPTWTDRLRTEPSIPDKMPEPFADIARHSLLRDPRSRWKLTDLTNRLNAAAPATAAPKEQPKTTVLERSAGPQKNSSNWLYAIPLAAMVGIILLLSSVAHRPASRSSKPKPKAATSSVQAVQAVPRNSTQAEAPKVTSGAVAPNQVVRQAVPDVPEKALRTIQGRLRVAVRAHVDEHGNVSRAEFVSRGPSRYFANLAMQSVPEWKFSPAQIQQTWVLQFTFTRSGVAVQPRQVG